MLYSKETEACVLGAILLDNTSMEDAAARLQENDFYFQQHKEIYNAMLVLNSHNEPITAVSLCQTLGDRLDAIGGYIYLAEIASMVPTAQRIKVDIDKVKDYSVRRALSAAFSGAVEALQKNYTTENIIEKISSILEQTETEQPQELLHVGENVLDVFEDINKRASGKNERKGVSVEFGIDDFQPGELEIIAARPSMGKTAFALNLASYVSVRVDTKITAIFSLEMSREQLIERLISSIACVELGKVRTGQMSDDEWLAATKIVGRLCESGLYIDDRPDIDLIKIKTACKKLQRDRGLDLIVIDYIQLMQVQGGENRSREQEVSKISRGLKLLAKELNVPIVALSQLSRENEKRKNHKPILSDLRESGAIEQNADVVIFLHREGYYDDSKPQDVAECIIAKNRNGACRTIKLDWFPQYTKFAKIRR